MRAVRNTCLGSRSDQGQESGGSRPLQNLKHTVPSRRHWIDKVSCYLCPVLINDPIFMMDPTEELEESMTRSITPGHRE